MPKPCYLAMCAIARDETPFLREWAAYHHLIGFERIFIYDNESQTPVSETLADMATAGLVEILSIRGDKQQLTAYNHCLREYGAECEWMAFFDLDEFLLIRNGLDARAFLTDFEDCGGVSINECQFTSSGHISRPQGLVLENYCQCRFESIVMKCVVRPRWTIMPISPHHFTYREGKNAVNANGLPVVGAYGPLAVDRAELFHYSWRSQQDFEIKINRQDAARPDNPRSPQTFYHQAYGPWTQRDDMLPYAEPVRMMMEQVASAPFFSLDAMTCRAEPYRPALSRLAAALATDELSCRPGLAHLLYCLNHKRFQDKTAYLGLGLRACLLAKDWPKAREAACGLINLAQNLPSYLELLRVELAAGEREKARNIGRFLVQTGRHLGDSSTREAALELAASYGLELKPGAGRS